MTEFLTTSDSFMFGNTTSLVDMDNRKSQQKDLVEIAQRLEPEQYLYEFPPKSQIISLDQVDQDNFSFFDESSFTTSNSTYSPIEEGDEDEDDYQHQNIPDLDDIVFENNSNELLNQYLDSYHTNYIVADHQLSPLQLPTQVEYQRSIRETSCSSTGTIKIYHPARPSSFLPYPYQQYLESLPEESRINWDRTSFVFPDYSNINSNHLSIGVHPFSRRNSVDPNYRLHSDELGCLNEDDRESHFSSHSKLILLKMNKSHKPVFIQYSHIAGSYTSTDEGYEDDEDINLKSNLSPIDSTSLFLPLTFQEQEEHEADLEIIYSVAATKIQAVWRGYYFRKHNRCSSHQVLAGLAHMNDCIHRRDYNQLQRHLNLVEKRLEEETAMRIAFEKAMENMTLVMDHQHHTLNERLEQEVSMRQAYERKMDHAIAQLQPLESRLRHESKARADIESMMSRMIDQLQHLKIQMKDESDQRKSLERQLDEAHEEIRQLKTPSSRPTSRLSTLPKNSTLLSTQTRTTPSRIGMTPILSGKDNSRATATPKLSGRISAGRDTPTKATSTRPTITPKLSGRIIAGRDTPTRPTVTPKLSARSSSRATMTPTVTSNLKSTGSTTTTIRKATTPITSTRKTVIKSK